MRIAFFSGGSINLYESDMASFTKQYADIDHCLLQRLREQTNNVHKKIEKNQLMMEVMSDSFSLTRYQQLLRSFFSFYQPVELKIKNLIFEHQIEYFYQPKCPLLEQDLLHLNVHNCNEDRKQLSTSFLHDKASLLGVLYVIEGSTLGGILIRKTIAKYINVNFMANFFYPYGQATRTKWQRTCDFIASYAQKEQLDIQSICEAAIHTFNMINKTLAASE
jgi:heme oxygenase